MAAQEKQRTPEKESVFFKDSFIRGETGTVRKAIAFPVAFLLHASLVLAAVVIPLLNTANLPEVEVYSAFHHLLHHHLLLQQKRKAGQKAGTASSLSRPNPTSNQDS